MSSTATHWSPYTPTAAEPWNLQRVVHLHRRAAFAAPWKVLQRDLEQGPTESIDRLLSGESNMEQAATNFESLARSIGDAAVASNNPSRLKAWWLYRMLLSPDPLAERLTLMWHNHFATSNLKVQDLRQMRGQNEVFRQHARGPFAELLSAVVKHPATLIWLDADSNRSGHPNENLARELMELFTLGIGNYDESDVQEAARVLTGWTVADDQFQFKETRHDAGVKKLFGQSAAFTGDDLVDKLVEHPSTAHRLAWRVCQTFLGEGNVDDQSLDALASGLRERKLNVGWAVETVLRSHRFFATQNLRARVVSPVEYVVGTVRALELCDKPPSTLALADWAARMGQDLFYPPNVGGWNEGRAWLASRSIVARANFATALVAGRLWQAEQKPNFQDLPQRHVPGIGDDQQTQLAKSVAWLASLLWGDAPQAAIREVVQATGSANSDQPLAVAVALLLARPENQLG